MEDLVQPTLAFISAHSGWAVAVMFVTSFGKSFAFVSLLFPGTSLLIAAGALMAAGSLPYLPVLAGAVLGAVLGDSVSYLDRPPLWRRHRPGSGRSRAIRDLLPSGIRFFARHGGKSVFIGRFFGPMRAVIPLAAGVMQMPRGPLLDRQCRLGDRLGADAAVRRRRRRRMSANSLIGSANAVLLVFGGLTLFGIAGVVWAAGEFGANGS